MGELKIFFGFLRPVSQYGHEQRLHKLMDLEQDFVA